MAYTTIDDPSAYFHVNLHSGNGTNNTDITFDANAGDFQPDWIWFKGRTSSAIDHALFDSSRGTTKILNSNNTNAENAQGATLKAFNSNGFRVGDDAGDYGVNASGRTYVTWNWKANGGTTASNTNGTINSTVQANTTAGFSIVTYTGNGSGGATIGHGLGVAPKWFFVKSRSVTNRSWIHYHNGFGTTPQNNYLNFTTAPGGTTSAAWNNTAPTTSVASLGSSAEVNENGTTFVGYFFAEKQGYSKFGSYTGNGNADGTFVYTGFKPSWTMIKNTQTNGYHWVIQDTKRFGGINSSATDKNLAANSNSAEPSSGSFAGNEIDFLSNGFKLRSNAGNTNAAQSYIYMAFAESPFVSSEGAPTTAR